MNMEEWMRDRPSFGTDGIRGKVGQGFLTPHGMVQLGLWMGRWLLTQHATDGCTVRVAVAYDTRKSSAMLLHALASGFQAQGVDVLVLGMLPTPALGGLTSSMDVGMGIMLTASHNQASDNGLKCFDAKGDKLSAKALASLQEIMYQKVEMAPTYGKMEWAKHAKSQYLEHAKKTLRDLGALEHFKGLKVVLDLANGAMTYLAPTLCTHLGIETVLIGEDGESGRINEACGSLYPQNARKTLAVSGGEFFLSFDGDGDRVIIGDFLGQILSGDDILYLLATSPLIAEKRSQVVATVMSNQGLVEGLAEKGMLCARTSVGDKHVFEAMLRLGASLGGEESGHIILHPWVQTSDGLIIGLITLATLVAEGARATGYRRAWKPYPVLMLNLQVEGVERVDHLVESLNDIVQTYPLVSKLVRKSGTEEKIRIRLEAREEKVLENARTQIMALAKRVKGMVCE